MLIDHFSISTISELDTSDSGGAPDPPAANFDLEWEAEAPSVDGEDEEELEYQKHQVYDDDDDWWNEYCIPKLEPTIEEEDEDNEEFEELLHWMDNKLDREIGENIRYDRLQYIVEFEFPAFAHTGADFDVPKVHRLTCIRSCKLPNPGNATLQVVEHSEMQDTPVFVHIGVVECAIGRVKTPRGWSIVDRSSEWARTVFTAEDVDEDAIDA